MRVPSHPSGLLRCSLTLRSAQSPQLLSWALLLVGIVAGSAAAPLAATAAPPVPRVVEVPSRPAFIRPPGGSEQPARPGQVLAARTLLRTQKPGRLQVQLADGRSFRLGGDAVARLAGSGVDLEGGQIIAWVNPGSKRSGPPLKIRTRVATASIVGTTVFLEATAETLKVFSWEGHVSVTTETGQRFELHSGQQVEFQQGAWLPPRRLSLDEAAARRRRSILLNGFTAPMETLPVLERELGLTPAPSATAPAPAAPAAPSTR